MTENFSTKGFIRAIPAMTRKVWPGIWPLIVVVIVSLYFSSAPLSVLPFSEWAIMHVLIVVGMISLTIWLYNTFEAAQGYQGAGRSRREAVNREFWRETHDS